MSRSSFLPGQFVGIEAHFDGSGYRCSPYCILSDPADAPHFEVLVRAVPEGPLSLYLADLEVGDEILFRGPTGRPMIPRFDDRELVLMATGTGVAPLVPLARHRLPALELLPAFLSHHPGQEDPKPTHVERPWNRPY